MKLFRKVLFPLFLITSVLAAQPTAPPTENLSLNIKFGRIFNDFGFILVTPFRSFPRNQLLLLGISTIPALLIWKGDKPIDEEYALERHRFPASVAHNLADVGNLYNQASSMVYVAGVTATLGATALLRRDGKMWQTAGLLVEAEIFTFLTVSAMKTVVGRARPFTDKGPHRFDLFRFHTQHPDISMPSLHTASVFALATVLSDQYPRWWVKIPTFAFAVTVAFQRMESREHWASDVFVGGVMGYYIAHSLFKRRHPPQKREIRLTPLFRSNLAGVTVYF